MVISGVLCVTRQCKRRVIVTLLSRSVQLSWQASCQLSLCSFVDNTNGTSANPSWRQCDAETLKHTHTAVEVCLMLNTLNTPQTCLNEQAGN